MSENIFADDWHECLEAHYMHVVRTEDRVTLPSLTIVMQQAGFNETELAELRVRATMHVDDVGADFVPDLEALKPAPDAAPPVEADSPQVFAVPEAAVEESASEDALLQPDNELEEQDMIEAVLEEAPQDDPDAPQQLSLF